MSQKKSSRFHSYLLLLTNTIVWGAAFVVTKPALSVTTPFRFLFYRYLIAGVLALPILLFLLKTTKKSVLKKVNLSNIFFLETLGSGLALGVLYSGLQLTSALEANLLTTTVPIFVTLGGILLLREKQERHEWFGLGLAFIGTLVLTLAPIFGLNGQFTQFSIWGNVLILLHNSINLFYFPLAKKMYQGIPKLLVSSISFYVSLCIFTVLSILELGTGNSGTLFTYAYQELTTLSVLWPAFYMAVFGSIIGLTAYIKGQEGIEASEASLFWYLQPLVYIPLGFLLLGEKINTVQVISLLVIFTGVFIAEKRTKHS